MVLPVVLLSFACPQTWFAFGSQCSIDHYATWACSFSSVSAVCPHILCPTVGMSQCFPTICLNQGINSSAEPLVIELARIYRDLSRAVAVGNNFLVKTPPTILRECGSYTRYCLTPHQAFLCRDSSTSSLTTHRLPTDI